MQYCTWPRYCWPDPSRWRRRGKPACRPCTRCTASSRNPRRRPCVEHGADRTDRDARRMTAMIAAGDLEEPPSERETRPFSTYLTHVRWTPNGTRFSDLQATEQAWQPIHFRWSMAKPYRILMFLVCCFRTMAMRAAMAVVLDQAIADRFHSRTHPAMKIPARGSFVGMAKPLRQAKNPSGLRPTPRTCDRCAVS